MSQEVFWAKSNIVWSQWINIPKILSIFELTRNNSRNRGQEWNSGDEIIISGVEVSIRKIFSHNDKLLLNETRE